MTRAPTADILLKLLRELHADPHCSYVSLTYDDAAGVWSAAVTYAGVIYRTDSPLGATAAIIHTYEKAHESTV